MKGTNEDLGKKILAESGLPIIAANTMGEAAQKWWLRPRAIEACDAVYLTAIQHD